MIKLPHNMIYYIFIVFVANQAIVRGENCKYVTIPVCGGDQQSITEILSDRPALGSRNAGPPGKIGPPGPRGREGQKGDPGTPGVDSNSISMSVVEDLISSKVEERLKEASTATGADFCKTAEEGVHTVYGELFYCDGNGWTVIQRRNDNSVDFERNWIDYRLGFGNMEGNFWLGLDKIYKLVQQRVCRLRIDLESFDHDQAYANYSFFSILSEGEKFALSVGGYEGTAGDSFGTYHNGMKFTTKDQDNDISKTNCATSNGGQGGWWFKDCFRASLNAVWGQSTGNWHNIVYHSFKRTEHKMKATSMKIQCD